jgi:PTS system galactitol-specific IIC component
MVITSLYAASKMAVFITEMAASNNYHLVGFNGVFTSFLDGGNYFRAWLVQLVSLNTIGLLFLPVVIIMLVFTWKETKNINSEENS